jgi:hypothetical protein
MVESTSICTKEGFFVTDREAGVFFVSLAEYLYVEFINTRRANNYMPAHLQHPSPCIFYAGSSSFSWEAAAAVMDFVRS